MAQLPLPQVRRHDHLNARLFGVDSLEDRRTVTSKALSVSHPVSDWTRSIASTGLDESVLFNKATLIHASCRQVQGFRTCIRRRFVSLLENGEGEDMITITSCSGENDSTLTKSDRKRKARLLENATKGHMNKGTSKLEMKCLRARFASCHQCEKDFEVTAHWAMSYYCYPGMALCAISLIVPWPRFRKSERWEVPDRENSGSWGCRRWCAPEARRRLYAVFLSSGRSGGWVSNRPSPRAGLDDCEGV